MTVGWILRLFSSNKKEAHKRYRKFVSEGIQSGSPWDDLQGQILLGEDGFIDKFKDHLTDRSYPPLLCHLQLEVLTDL
jgi:hypothetical protein